MKHLYQISKIAKSILFAIILLLAAKQSNAQTKPVASGYAPTKGSKIYYEVYGHGQPLILLHGAFMTIDGNWSQLIPELAKTRQVIAIESQGHGHTPYSDRKLSQAGMASDVQDVMNFLRIDSADVAGYSMGGTVAYQFAVSYPKRLKKLIIISSTYKSSGWNPEINNAFKSWKPEMFANSPMQTAYETTAPDKTKWNSFIAQMIVFVQTPFDIGDVNIAKITAPVMLICADNDGLDKVELAKTYKLLGGGVAADLQPMPKSRLAIVPAQGHVSLMMQTSTILGYMNEFLK